MFRFKKKKGALETQAIHHFPEVSTVIYCSWQDVFWETYIASMDNFDLISGD